MRVSIDPAVEEAPPPPYTAYEADPTVTPEYVSPETTSLPIRTRLRGGYTRSLPGQQSEDSQPLSPAAYFEERRFQRDHASEELDILEHNIHFDSGSTPTRLPFPHPSDVYIRRDVTGQDWATFVNYLFPIQQENHETKVDHLNSPERREKIQAVIAEWNVGFFAPRLIRIIAHFEPLSIRRAPSSAELQAPRYGDENPRKFSQYHETLNRGPSAPAYDFPSSSPGPSQAGLSNLGSPRNLHRSSSKSSISSSSSSSSESSVDSIASRDLDHATLPEIQGLIAAFRADPHKKNHISKSVKELRTQIRTQHLPFSSSDPYNTKFSKDEKKKFKEQRKVLKKEIKAIIKDAKDERKTERKFRRTARKNRRDARKQERRELRHARRDEKHCRRNERRSSRGLDRCNDSELQHNLQDPSFQDPRLQDPRFRHPHFQDPRFQDPRFRHPHFQHPHFQDSRHQDPRLQAQSPSSRPFPGIPQARAACARTTSWSSERVAAVRTRSNDAAASARLKAELVRQHTADVAAAARESGHQTGLHARDRASKASRHISNTAANAAAKAQDSAYGVSRRVSEQANSATEIARRQFDGEDRARSASAQQRADATASVLAGRDWDKKAEEEGKEAQRSEDAVSSGRRRRSGVAELRAQTTGENVDGVGTAELRTQTTGENVDGVGMAELRIHTTG